MRPHPHAAAPARLALPPAGRGQSPNPMRTRHLKVLIGGSLEDFVGDIIVEAARQRLGYDHVTVRTIQDLRPFLKAAEQTAPDVLLVYLYFGQMADETAPDHAACRAAIEGRLEEGGESFCSITACGLRLLPFLRVRLRQPIIVLTGSEPRPGRATRLEHAGAAAFLPVPFTQAECAAALGSCLERNP